MRDLYKSLIYFILEKMADKFCRIPESNLDV